MRLWPKEAPIQLLCGPRIYYTASRPRSRAFSLEMCAILKSWIEVSSFAVVGGRKGRWFGVYGLGVRGLGFRVKGLGRRPTWIELGY